MSHIFDNISERLGDQLQKTFASFDRMDVAVGYFNLRGWEVFDELVRFKPRGTAPVVRILIGMVTTGPQAEALDELQDKIDGTTRPDADPPLARERKAALVEQLRVQLMRGLPNTTDRRTLASLRDLIAEGAVEVKVFTRRPLHGKTYILHREDVVNPITGYVGSSNLTRPGLLQNYELNVDVVDSTEARELSEWFDARWDDRFSWLVTTELLELIDESWATPQLRRPYEVFLKVCYDLSRDVRDGLAEYSVPSEIESKLLNYQAIAVRTLARRIVTRGGTMLGDVVGLGKTLTAIAVALMLREEHGYIPLIVCPKNLVQMWQEHLEAYDIHGRVVSYSTAHTVLPDLRRYAFVIVDESHTLRNESRRDYKAIKEYIEAFDSKVMLLTATPYNLRFRDVANQLALFIGEDDDLGIVPVNALRDDPNLSDKVDGKISTLGAFRRSEDPDDWKRLMGEHLVRRTRSFIKNNFSDEAEDGSKYLEFSDGTRFSFPERVARPIEHSFGENDPASRMADTATLDALRGLSLPRYEMSGFLATGMAHTDSDKEFVDNITRARGNVGGFVRTTFYKRLSSCGYSFTLSLRRHLARNELFIYAFDQGLPLPTGTIVDTSFLDETDPTENDVDAVESLSDEPSRRYQNLTASNPSGVTWVKPTLFTPAFRDALQQDSETLAGLLDSYGTWSPAVDSKLTALIELLQVTHPDEKVLIFTEYKDTAVYVESALIAAGVTNIGLATGQSENPTAVARRFSPKSNALPGMDIDSGGGELRVLVATDVLSEGQNLQDAHIVVNYDLPWAIIRLIQRAGRVDRVGQKADQVLIYSFFHESVDAVLALRQRIADRLAANAEAFGSDERFFGSENEVKAITDLYNGTLDESDTAEDVDASSLAYQYWRTAEEEDSEFAKRIAALPDMIDATRAKRITESEDGVICYVRTEAGTDGFGRIAGDGEMRLLTGLEALRAFEATPDEQGLAHRSDHDELLQQLVRGPLATPSAAAGRLRGVRRMLWRRLGETVFDWDAETQAALEALFQHALTGEADRRLRKALRNQISDEDLAFRIVALHREDRLVIESRSGNDPVRIVSSMGVQT
jgi:superfamily II DNA or RNA helicase